MRVRPREETSLRKTSIDDGFEFGSARGFPDSLGEHQKISFSGSFFPKSLATTPDAPPIMGHPQDTDKTVMPIAIVHHQLLIFRGKG
ncbi:hypothetical protein BOX30_04305 [Leptospirillum ferriphilum]|nr:hypothetical protein BOX30_04305 [Leptospirillum ferriphilum]